MLMQMMAVVSMMAAMAAAPALGQCGGHGGGHGKQPEASGKAQPASTPAGHAHAQPSAGQKAVNAICPVGKEPIDGRSFLAYEGDVVGFCCPGCDETFLDWEKNRRDAFVAGAKSAGAPVLASQPERKEPKTPEQPKPAEKPKAAKPSLGTVYPLANCPISGKALGSMGDPVIKVYDGREVRFCCASCVPRFEGDKEAQFKKIDEQIVRMQMPFYPLDTCIVGGEKLGSMGEPDDSIYQNRLVRFCCESCRGEFEDSAADFIAKLDKAAADEQRAKYPLETCMVTGKRLGSMGEPAEVILAGRLVRMCCPPCERQLRLEPAKFIATLDDAWRKAGRPGMPEKPEKP